MKKNNKLMPIREAERILLKNAFEIKKTETISLLNSENRVLAENIYSTINLPEENNAAVDGYAFNYKKLKKSKNKVKIVGESSPGKPFLGKVNSDQTIKVYTGALIIKSKYPSIDTVVMEEDCEIRNDKNIIINNFPKVGANIRKKGEDLKVNQLILKKNRKIRTVDLAQLSSIGKKKIKVFKKVKVGIFSTGNELQEFDSKKKKYHIFDSNKLILISLFKKLNCDVFDLGIIKDDFLETKKKIVQNSKNFDLIITSGGISTSSIDKVSELLLSNGLINFWRLAIKPGRPIAFGKINKTPFIGLPGNPVAAIITFFMLITQFVEKVSGNQERKLLSRCFPSSFNMKKKRGRTEWLRGSIIKVKNKYLIHKFSTTGSGIISSITKSDGIIVIDEEITNIKKGDLLKFYKFEDFIN